MLCDVSSDWSKFSLLGSDWSERKGEAVAVEDRRGHWGQDGRAAKGQRLCWLTIG